MMLGLGCAVENMVIGVKALDFTPILNLFQAGTNSSHIPHMTVFPGSPKEPPEVKFLTKRRTHRGSYIRNKRIPDAVLDRLFAQTEQTRAWLGADGAAGESFARGTLEATKAIIADTEMFSESNKWMRHDLATVNKFCNGITTTTAGLSPIMALLALTFPTSIISEKEHEQWLKIKRDVQIPTAPLFGLISVSDASDQNALVEAGRLWQRLHLAGTQNKITATPQSDDGDG